MNESEDNSKKILPILMIIFATGAVYKLVVKTSKEIFKSATQKDFILSQMFTESIKRFLNLNDRNKHFEKSVPLIDATKKGELEIVKELLSKGVDINTRDSFGCTALIIASQNMHSEIVKELLSKGADVHAKSGYCNTALFEAAKAGNVNIVKQLISKGAMKDDRSYMAFLLAAKGGHLDIVKEFISNGIDINIKDNQGVTALILVSQRVIILENHIKVVKLLISQGVDVNARDDEGNTALKYALKNPENKNFIEILRTAGAKAE